MRVTLQILLISVGVMSCLSAALAESSRERGTHRRHHATRVLPGRLVLHPAWSFACMTRDRATRALPCDQPIWVYGSPCEVDLGRGRYRPC
jgi:hypothetical protein